MRKLLTATLAALSCLALVAAPAPAKPKLPVDPWYSTIDCGLGPVSVVSSGADEWSKLEDLGSRRRYKPIEWHLQVGDRTYDAVRPGKLPKRTMTCSYGDDFATGTVVVKYKSFFDRDEDDRDDD